MRTEPIHELLARLRKSTAIAQHVWAGLSAEDRKDSQTPWRISRAEPPLRVQFAAAAGQKEPSDATWEQVVTHLCVLANSERRCMPEPCEACDGKGTYESYVPHGSESGWAGHDVEMVCRDCRETGYVQCESCGQEPGMVVVPLGLYGADCSECFYPEIARHARAVLAEGARAPELGDMRRPVDESPRRAVASLAPARSAGSGRRA